jgi:hypothetical protein
MLLLFVCFLMKKIIYKKAKKNKRKLSTCLLISQDVFVSSGDVL